MVEDRAVSAPLRARDPGAVQAVIEWRKRQEEA